MNQSFNIQFYCRQSKATKNGYAPLEIAININGVRKFINLPYKCLPSDFNRKRQPKELVEYQSTMRRKINEIIADMAANNIPLTTASLVSYLKTGGTKSYTIQNLFDEYLDILKTRLNKTITKSVYSKYELVRELFYTIADKNSECNTISNFHIKKFKAVCESKYKESTTGGYLQKLKTVITYAQDNGRLKINPFQGVKITKGNKDITYLTEDELHRLESLHIENESLRNVRDCFLFECYSGISYSDLCALKPQDFRNENGVWYIQGFRKKTGKEYTSVLLPNFLNLVEVQNEVKYDNRLNDNGLKIDKMNFEGDLSENRGENQGNESGNNFVTFCNPLKIKELRFKMISNQKINSYLHAIERLFSFDKSLTTHLARHTYATLLANKYKCRMEVVASALGDSLKITTKHYAKFLSETTISEIGNNIKSVV